MRNSTSEDVFRWLVDHAESCERCRDALLASKDEDLSDGEAARRCCRYGAAFVRQVNRKFQREEEAGG